MRLEERLRGTRRAWIVAVVAAAALAGCADTRGPVDDATLAAEVRTALQRDATLRSFAIAVASHNRVVELTGAVTTPADADHAQEVAVNVPGVRTVHNNLIVK